MRRRVGAEDDELVAPAAGEVIGLPKLAGEERCDALQDAVRPAVSEALVVALETIDVDDLREHG